MSKWADYCITAVRFNKERTHIDRVKVQPDTGSSLGAESEATREAVVAAIKEGATFVTAYKTAAGSWSKGKDVVITKVDGVEYLKTVANNKPEDNLENLPEF